MRNSRKIREDRDRKICNMLKLFPPTDESVEQAIIEDARV